MITVICQFCKTEFDTKPCMIKKGWGKYCSQSCNAKAHPINQKKIKRNYGKDHPGWKGGKTTHSAGYILLNFGKKKVYEHRYIMEQYLHRKLEFNETIHHVNGNKKDNRIENLQILTRPDHSHKHSTFRGGTIIMNCKKCKKRFFSFKSEKRDGYCSKICWYSRNK